MAEERVYRGRRVSDFKLFSAQEVFEQKLAADHFVDPDKNYLLKFVAPYERKARSDSKTPGSEKPKVKVRAYFRKKLSLNDYRELHGVNGELKGVEHVLHHKESDWHRDWQTRVSSFCEIERRFYPDGVKTENGYKIADAFYEKANTIIEFQKSFDDSALEKTHFYAHEKLRLIWLFCLPTLEVFEDEGVYKIGEDNMYHFFRIEDLMPGFFENNVVFIQDEKERIYYVGKLGRVDSKTELEATVRYFEKGLTFGGSDSFAVWLKDEWPESPLFIKNKEKLILKSATEILADFEGKPDSYFYLQNCTKNDKNGMPLIYCFRKDNGVIRQKEDYYLSYRCFDKSGIYYVVNDRWACTIQSKTAKQWVLLATNRKKYRDEVDVQQWKSEKTL